MDKQWPVEPGAAFIAGVYAAFGTLWILLSDHFLAGRVLELEQLTRLQTFKGWAYVLLSGLLVLVLAHRWLRGQAQRARELEEHVAQVGRVVDAMPALVAYLDTDFRHRFANAAYCRLIGRACEALIGRPVEEGLPPEILARLRPWLARLQAGEAVEYEERVRLAGEPEARWLRLRCQPERDGSGAVVGVWTFMFDLTHVKNFEARLEHLVHYDPLTGLPNRVKLADSVQHALAVARRSGDGGALLLLDIDRFKTLNDSLGHPAGDEVLCILAERLQQRLRYGDTLARVGGDEFAVLMERCKAPQASHLAVELLTAVREPVLLGGERQVVLEASIGISLFPEDGEDAATLLRNADAALYQAKENGRGTYRFYTQHLTRMAAERLDLEYRLRQAIQQGHLQLHYQPLVALADGRIHGVEALLRWYDPVEGFISPARFIPIAEESGLIIELGDLVLRLACAQARRWAAAGHTHLRVAVNVSPRQFQQGQVDRVIATLLAEAGLPGSSLEVEITEGALMGREAEVEARLTRLRELGVRIAIDDFGTGYSSLSYLNRLPIDKLKIDQSFVRDLVRDEGAREIAATIIAMAHNLRVEALAEGIETPEQLAFLTARGCESGQGYLFSRPLPAEELDPLLARGAIVVAMA